MQFYSDFGDFSHDLGKQRTRGPACLLCGRHICSSVLLWFVCRSFSLFDPIWVRKLSCLIKALQFPSSMDGVCADTPSASACGGGIPGKSQPLRESVCCGVNEDRTVSSADACVGDLFEGRFVLSGRLAAVSFITSILWTSQSGAAAAHLFHLFTPPFFYCS